MLMWGEIVCLSVGLKGFIYTLCVFLPMGDRNTMARVQALAVQTNWVF